MYSVRQVLWNLQLALNERLVDDHLGSYIRQFTFLPGFDLLAHGLKVSPDAIHSKRDAVDERELLRVFGEQGVNALETMFPKFGPDEGFHVEAAPSLEPV